MLRPASVWRPGAAWGVIAPSDLPRRLLIVSDVDSTFIGREVIDSSRRQAGSESGWPRSPGGHAWRARLRQEPQARVATLAGLPVAVLDEVRADVTLTPGVPRAAGLGR